MSEAGGAERRQELRIPIRPNMDAVLYVPFPMTSGDWDQLMAVLAAMKPGIVKDPADTPSLMCGQAQ